MGGWLDFADIEILFGLTLRDLLDYSLLVLIFAGIVYSFYFRRSKNEFD
jgi:hypothetical protein